MITNEIFEECVRRAALAPTVHNTQPARWTREGDVVSLFCDTDAGLPVADPDGRDAALSCGAVLEAMILALSAHGVGGDVRYTGHPTHPRQGLVAVAHVTLVSRADAVDGLHHCLEKRFTWRSAFAEGAPDLYGWGRTDMRLVLPQKDRVWIAAQNDWASHEILQDPAFRAELVDWMRLSDTHPRAGRDGMDRDALCLTPLQARMVPWTLLHAWPLLRLIKATKRVTSEAEVTLTAPVIALFHRDISENPVVSGRAYLRMCLEAASLGFAGWPMAALADHPDTNAALCQQFGIGSDRRLIQAIRFGAPAAPPAGRLTGAECGRARRPLAEVLRSSTTP